MNKYLRISVLTSLASASLALGTTTEFRTPQRLIRGEMHWPLKPVEEAWWYDKMDTEDREIDNWSIDAWAGYYGINAGAAFFKPNGGITTDTASLSALWFGTESFRGIDLLAAQPSPQQLMDSNPFLGFARISPTFSYSEKGAVFGLRTMRTFGCDNQWHTGFRISLPVKEIEIEQDANAAVEETLDDVVFQYYTNLKTSPSASQIDFAYRLDFLTSLGVPLYVPTGSGIEVTPFVQYGNGDGTTLRDTKVYSQDVSSDTAAGTCGGPDGTNCFPCAYVIRADTNTIPSANSCCPSSFNVGVAPQPPFYRFDTQVSTFVNADGSGGVDGDALYFKLTGQNYLTGGLATDTAAQGALFLVPRAVLVTAPGEVFELTAESQIIQSGVATLLELLEDSSASLFFEQNGISLFADEHIVGVGDLTVEWYVGYGDRYDWYVDGIIGAIFPTGTDNRSSKDIFYEPTGNHKHYELKLGAEGGYNWCDLIAIRGEVFYGHAFSGREDRAVVFASPSTTTTTTTSSCSSSCNTSCSNSSSTDSCALFLRNIGSPICVDVSWNWFYGRLDFTLFHPYNSDLGFTFGYEFYWKSHDSIGIDCGDDCTNNTTVMATDLLGQTGVVDFCGMERNSQVFSNKVYGEVFHRWSFFELFAGASQIVAGENVMKETEAHLGLRIYY